MVSVALVALLIIWISIQLADKGWFARRGIERGLFTLIIRSKKGIEAIDREAKKRRRFYRRLGNLGVLISVPMIVLVVISLIFSAGHILQTPDAPPGIAPLLPEGVVDIEGAPSIPLNYWLIAIISILIVHELMHGLLARVEDIPIKSLGIFSVTLIPLGAFIEPDDDVLETKSSMAKMRVYAAGSLGNFIAAILGGLVLAFLLMVVAPLAFNTTGVVIQNVTTSSPAEIVGVTANLSLLAIGEVEINDLKDFREAIPTLIPGEPVILRTDTGEFVVTPIEREGFTHGFIGIAVLPRVEVEAFLANSLGTKRTFAVYGTVFEAVGWIALLNFFVGLTNLLPILPLDGGRMFALFVENFAPKSSRQLKTIMFLFLIGLVFINAGPLFGFFR